MAAVAGANNMKSADAHIRRCVLGWDRQMFDKCFEIRRITDENRCMNIFTVDPSHDIVLRRLGFAQGNFYLFFIISQQDPEILHLIIRHSLVPFVEFVKSLPHDGPNVLFFLTSDTTILTKRSCHEFFCSSPPPSFPLGKKENQIICCRFVITESCVPSVIDLYAGNSTYFEIMLDYAKALSPRSSDMQSPTI